MYIKIFIILISAKCILTWDSEQMEVFDLVEEVKQNFYELLNVSQVSWSKKMNSFFYHFSNNRMRIIRKYEQHLKRYH